MNRLIAVACFAMGVAYCFLAMPDGALAAIVAAAGAVCVIAVINRVDLDTRFLINLFLLALLARLALAAVIYNFELFDFFGPDARGYENIGMLIAKVWNGTGNSTDPTVIDAMRLNGAGWGMNYFSAILYWLTGSNLFIGQAVSSVLGAATVPLSYYCTWQIYGNKRASRIAAALIAFFPSFIIWSAQFLKDAPILFFLVLAMTLVLTLQKKLSFWGVAVLILSLVAILSLRFYIFYLVTAAVGVGFFVGTVSKRGALTRRLVIVSVLVGALAALGLIRIASADLLRFGSLERIEVSRKYAASVAGSGYETRGVNSASLSGVISILPVGLAYLFLAPFPWEVTNFRQAATLPEMVVWWAMLPLVVIGLLYTIRHRFRAAIPIFVFSLILTVLYALYQGNVGTAYRQRTQIQVFLMYFVAVAVVLQMEKRDDRKLVERRYRSQQILSRHGEIER